MSKIDFKEINLQPLAEYTPQPGLSIRELNQKFKLANTGDLLAIGVDKDLWYQAVLVASKLNLNIERILDYIASQIPLKPDKLVFEPNKSRSTNTTEISDEDLNFLMFNLEKYGKKISGRILSGFMCLEQGLNVAKCSDVLNAIFAQLILNQKVELIISDSAKKYYDIPKWSENLSDAPTLGVLDFRDFIKSNS